MIVAATGPSLTQEVAGALQNRTVLAINDAWRLIPWAEVLYACDEAWWNVHNGCSDFKGEKWSSHGDGHNEKMACAERFGLNLVRGDHHDTFSLNPEKIHYGSNSGFQGINLAILFGAKRVVLVGFDMRVNGKRHFFGDHPAGLSNQTDYTTWVPQFANAAKKLTGVEIVNATPGSALTCFKMMGLDDALSASP